MAITITFEGKVALVTGAGGGIGLVTAKAFAEAGASVVLVDRNASLLTEAVEALQAAGLKVMAAICDVTDRSQVRATMERTLDTYGRLNAAFNNAGINCVGAPMLESDDDEFDRVVGINLRGV